MKRPVPTECEGQLRLVCEGCDGQKLIVSDDTPPEVCDECGGTGIDPDAAFTAVAVRGFWREARWEPGAAPRLDFSAYGR